MAKILLVLLLAASVAGGSLASTTIEPSSTDIAGTDITPTNALPNIPATASAGPGDMHSKTALPNILASASAGPGDSDSTATVVPTKTIDDNMDFVKSACNQCDVDPVVNAPTAEEKCENIPAITDCVEEQCAQENLQGKLKAASKACRADDDVLKKWAASALIEVECKTTGSSNCSEEANEVVNALSNGITKACTKVKAFTTCQDNNCEETYLYTDIKEAFKEKCGCSIIQVSALALVLSLLLRFL